MNKIAPQHQFMSKEYWKVMLYIFLLTLEFLGGSLSAPGVSLMPMKVSKRLVEVAPLGNLCSTLGSNDLILGASRTCSSRHTHAAERCS